GWIALGVSAIATGTAIVMGFRTLDARDDYNNSPPGGKTVEKRDTAINRMHVTNYAWATAVITGAAGAGILLFVPSESSSSSSSSTSGFSVMPKGFQIRGQF